jgi:uncharacterized protein
VAKALPEGAELATSRLAQVEITRTLLRSGVDHQRIPYLTGQALLGIYLIDLTSTVLTRATTYRVTKLGTLGSIHLASAEPFRAELTEFVTYDLELSEAARHRGFPISAPS